MEPAIFYTFQKGVMEGALRKGSNQDPEMLTFADLTPEEVIASWIVMLGRSSELLKNGAKLETQAKQHAVASIIHILEFDEGEDELPEKATQVTCGQRYIDWYCDLMMRINKSLLREAFKEGKVGHAIDAENVYLLDALYIPGFGEQVAEGLTVWTYATSYSWLSRIYGKFAEQVQADCQKPVIYHQECTELFQFTDFLLQFGMPCIDNPNYMVLASMSTSKPLNFKRYPKEPKDTPAALLFDSGRWFRDSHLLMTTPDEAAKKYTELKEFIYQDGKEGREDIMWGGIEKGAVQIGSKDVGEALFIHSTSLVDKYIGCPHTRSADACCTGCVKYG
jgi:hypothetical protein